MMALDWIDKLRHLLLTLAFCLVIATLHYGFLPDRPYAPPVAYSVAIGIVTWAVIDLGRHLFPSARETGWPQGLAGALLVAGGIATGFFLGTAIADQLCRLFGWYAAGPVVDRGAELRTSLLITIPAGLIGSFFFYSVNKSRYLERKMGEAREHANEARLKLLEAQLEPHMLFNTLANLRALIAVDPPRAQQMLDHMIAYLRATLAASRSTLHPLRAEFERLRDYLELMAVRMGPRMQFALDLPRELEERKVPALLLQPLVENAIQHGLEPQVGGGRIDVTARIEAGQLVLRVEDTGAGAPAIPAKAGVQGAPGGFGLTQVRERLHTLYGDDATFRFDARPGQGANAEIRLPLDA